MLLIFCAPELLADLMDQTDLPNTVQNAHAFAPSRDAAWHGQSSLVGKLLSCGCASAGDFVPPTVALPDKYL